MRFFKKVKPSKWNIVDDKIVTETFFAWFPVTIGNETRFLEKVTVSKREICKQSKKHPNFFVTEYNYLNFV